MKSREFLVAVSMSMIGIGLVVATWVFPARAQETPQQIMAQEIVLVDQAGTPRMVLSGTTDEIMVSGSDGTYKLRLAVQEHPMRNEFGPLVGEYGVIEVLGQPNQKVVVTGANTFPGNATVEVWRGGFITDKLPASGR